MIATASSTAHQLLGSWQSVGIRRRGDQCHGLMLCDRLDNLVTKQSPAQKQAQQSDVDNRGDRHAVGAIVVVVPPYLVRSSRNPRG